MSKNKRANNHANNHHTKKMHTILVNDEEHQELLRRAKEQTISLRAVIHQLLFPTRIMTAPLEVPAA